MSSNIPPKNNDPERNPKNNGEIYFQPNPKDLIAYGLLIVGIILLFFSPIYGEILIGIVAGVYFSKEILSVVQDANAQIERIGLSRSLIIAGILLAFLISAPAIFIGAAVVVLLRWFVFNEAA